MRRRSRRRQQEAADINITAFMNLMVILVPFLLITAVFSRLAVLELNLPTEGAVADAETPELVLEVIIRADAIEVGDRTTGLLESFAAADTGHDLEGLREFLKQVKATYPDKLDATVLMEPEITYDTLIQVMDTVRVYPDLTTGELVHAELFPEISIGDAPMMAASQGS